MVGEQADRLDVDARGVVGDRRWSVRTASGRIGSGKATRRFEAVPGLLDLRAEHRSGEVWVVFPDGSCCPAESTDAGGRLSDYLGRAVSLTAEAAVSHFDDGPVSLIGTASLRALAADAGHDVDPRRFRPNLLVATDTPFVEDGWVGHLLEVGSVRLRVTMTSPRCVMVDARTAELPAEPGNLTAVGRVNRACLGVIAAVERPGRIAVGDDVRLCR